MRNTIRWIAVVLLQAPVLLGAAAQTTVDQSQQSIDHRRWMPIADFQPPASDAPNGVMRSRGAESNEDAAAAARREIGPLAQGFGTSRSVADNVKASPGVPENAMLNAIKALHEEVKSLETRMAAQDARIAMLERTLEDYTARKR